MIKLESVLPREVIDEQLQSGYYRIITCPVCHNETFDNFSICPHCDWEQDEFVHKGYSCANRSYMWWYRLKYKLRKKRRKNR